MCMNNALLWQNLGIPQNLSHLRSFTLWIYIQKKTLILEGKNNGKEKYTVHDITVIMSYTNFFSPLYFLHICDIWEEKSVLEAFF